MQVFIRNKLMERHLKLEKELADTERDCAAHVIKSFKIWEKSKSIYPTRYGFSKFHFKVDKKFSRTD